MVVSREITAEGNAIVESSEEISYAITAAFFCNLSETESGTISLHLVKAGETPSRNNCIFKDYEITPTNTMAFEQERIILENGDYLYGVGENGTIIATVSIMEI